MTLTFANDASGGRGGGGGPAQGPQQIANEGGPGGGGGRGGGGRGGGLFSGTVASVTPSAEAVTRSDILKDDGNRLVRMSELLHVQRASPEPLAWR